MRALCIGRFHAVTAEQATWIAELGRDADLDDIVCVVTSADHVGTRRNPFDAATREALLAPALAATGLPFRIVEIRDIPDDERWVAHVESELARLASIRLVPSETLVASANTTVQDLFRNAGYAVASRAVVGPTPHELLQRVVDGKPWQDLASPATRALLSRPDIVESLRQIFRYTVRTDDGELGHQRDFDSYGAQMDAALWQKLEDLLPWVKPGLVVDKGCGTGKLLVALARRWPQSAFVGVDLSREFLRRSDENTYAAEDVDFVLGDAADQQIESGRASTIIFSSIMHEVYSYSGYSRQRVMAALRSAFAELAPGGRMLMRDGISPPPGIRRIRFLRPEVAAQFEKFAVEFRHGAGVAFCRIDGDTVELSAHDANEFLCKKDYLKNWHIEVHEEFGVFTLEEWRAALSAVGFTCREARGYASPWIVTHRYEGSVQLLDSSGAPVGWPDTNAVVVGEKPGDASEGADHEHRS